MNEVTLPSFAVSCTFAIKVYKKCQKEQQKKFLFQNLIWVSKNAEFHADFKSVEKVLKKCTKKVISKNVTEICTFFTFTRVRQTCFAITFFGAFFNNFFNRFNISVKFCVFDTFFYFSIKFLFWSY